MSIDVVILGAGESGVGAALLAKKQGLSVFVSDLSEIKEQYKKELDDVNIEYEQKQHSEELVLSASLIVKSPGIPDTVPLIVKLLAKGTEVISEIEFASRYCSAKYICITGSNGKTTTTLLVHHILKNAGLNLGLAGNIGYSLARQVSQGADVDWYVLELSSFQLDGMYSFKANIAIILNITPDHLDRYNYKMENYVDSKFRILQNQTSDNYFIYCADDNTLLDKLSRHQNKAKQIPFSYYNKLEEGAYYDEHNITFKVMGNEMILPVNQLKIQGQHNKYNAMAAGIVAQILELDKSAIEEGLSSFKSVEHRLEFVLLHNGIQFINDSKATNVDSAWYALESMETPVIWIAGGVDKGNDYSKIKELASERVKALVCLGTDNNKLITEFTGLVPNVVEAKSMKEAVDLAYNFGVDGDSILLSPACASFDLFDNYEQRGQLFKEHVRNL